MTEPDATPPPIPYVPGPTPRLEATPPVIVPEPPKRGARPLAFAVVGLVAGLAIGAGATVALDGGSADPALAAATPGVSPVYVTVTVTVAAPTTAAATTSPPAPPTTAAAPPPAATIEDGTWTVGEDVPAGTYKVTGAGSNCYWAILKSGTNGRDIVDNHLGGGNLRVTIKAGQDFETHRCGMWIKV
ncbi:hypothetical protein [Dactylosporangium sp. CS-033363]|uniref:hypothetical protein n=1 Tax=Dactylosporangium sp. CS-033363 TaxID=3239935 RepID=UPI003D94A0F0